jgi:hypothetical protein
MRSITKSIIFVVLSVICASFTLGAGEDNGSMGVNITSAMPQINTNELNEQGDSGDESMDLTPGNTTSLMCSGNATDFDGNNDIDFIWADLYSNLTTYDSELNNTDHYQNSSCAYDAGASIYNCTFNVQFYADPTNWICNVSVNDSYNLTHYRHDNASITTLLAIDIPDATFLDFGDMMIGDNKSTEHNITLENKGNIEIDVDVDTWETTGDQDSANALNCSLGNIPIDNFRVSLTKGAYGTYTPMTQVGYTSYDNNLGRQVSGVSPTTDIVYLGLMIPALGMGGTCTGVISLQAVSS